MRSLTDKLKNLPSKPGIYLFKNAAGEILYVGKAKNLRSRVRSYFIPHPFALSPKGRGLRGEVRDFEYVIVSSELEALMLEGIFIKKHLPRFNVVLKDDKNYQFIKVDYSTEIPQVYTVRKVNYSEHSDAIRRFGSHSKYFGPYTSGLAVKNTLRLLKRIFHLCANNKTGKRACFQYHLGRCPGVCIGLISPAAYRRGFKLVERFLQSRQGEIVKMLKNEMREAASARQFEKAASARDKIFALTRIWEKQKIISPKKISEDYLGLYRSDMLSVVKLFQVREGRLAGQETFELKTAGSELPAEIIEAFATQYYLEASDKPKSVISRANAPSRGEKLGLLKLAEENARDYFEKNHARPEQVLLELQNCLQLPSLPRRIECYDISNLQGTNPVGSMVVFEDGLPKKSDYRKFKINTKDTPDDVAMMKEVLERRFKTAWPRPDLVVIDGGRGQLNAALKVLKAISYKLSVISLAKRLEEIYLPDLPKPLVLRLDSPVLQLLQRLRDEAHRFAVTFHTKRRGKVQVRSRLDDVPGVGPATKKLLLKNFGSLSGVRAAREEEIAKIIGPAKTKLVKERL